MAEGYSPDAYPCSKSARRVGLPLSITASIILGMGMDQAAKVRENRLRRMAQRQGLKLVRARRMDPRALDYGLYWLVTREGQQVTDEAGVSIDVIEERLTNPPPRNASPPTG